MASEKMMHPFQVFPEELWPVLIEKLEDSSEILRVMDAIPEIKDIMESRKRWWLFDQVIPLVSHWLGDRDMLSCRQVCKQWSIGLDNFLDNHPRFRAYDPHQSPPITGQAWTWENLPSTLSAKNYLRSVQFDSQDLIISFLWEMESHPKERSPIVGRAVYVDSMEDLGVLQGASEVFRRFGQHIWFLTLEDYQHTDPLPFSQAVEEWLGLLPNLKSLRLQMSLRNRDDVMNGYVNGNDVEEDEEEEDNEEQKEPEVEGAEPDEEAKEVPEEELKNEEKEETPAPPDDVPWTEPLPPLPHLETLEFHFDTVPESMANTLMSSYSLQLRRLWFPLRYWKPEYSSMFPNLTELTIEFIFSKRRLLNILLNLEAPLLYSLELWFDDTSKIDVETEILPWLKRFPRIRNLSLLMISGFSLPGGSVEMDLNPETDSVPSVKYLLVSEDFMHANSNFLLCFPNLEFLDFGDSPSIPEGHPLEPELNIWANIRNRTIYESNVWELLPNLKVISLTDPESDWNEPDIRFTRQTYEYRKKLAGPEAQPD